MLGDNIKRIRKSKGISINKLAKMSDTSLGYLSDIENNKKENPSRSILLKIANVLEVTVDYLTGNSIKAIIENKLSDIGMTFEELSEKSKVPMTFFNNLEDIVPDESDYKFINPIAAILNVNPGILRAAFARQEIPLSEYPNNPIRAYDDFINIDTKYPNLKEEVEIYDSINKDMSNVINIPIVGVVRAGIPILAQDNITGYLPTLKEFIDSDKNYFYLRVKGDSMNQEFKEGSLLLIEKTPCIENGQIGVVLIDGMDATVKKIVQNKNMITLIPMSTNPEYVPKMYDIQKNQVQIIGAVKQATKIY